LDIFLSVEPDGSADAAS